MTEETFQTYSLLHCHMTNSHLWQLLIDDPLEKTLSPYPCRLTQIPKHLHYSTHKKILVPFGLSWAVFWWITNTLKCSITEILWTKMCMWCSVQSQLAEFCKERGVSHSTYQKVLLYLCDSAAYLQLTLRLCSSYSSCVLKF